MSDLPILMNAEMVRATLRNENPKTQTRRIVNGFALELLQPDNFTPEYVVLPENGLSPYGFAGDRLYVRETFIAFGRWETRFSQKKGRDEWHFVDMTMETGREYRFDGALPNAARGSVTPAWWRRPSIFMPRAAARITLEVIGVRVERLQEISEKDALAEGCALNDINPRGCFGELWNSLAGRDADWNSNPWVWVVEFKRIDACPKQHPESSKRHATHGE